MSSSGSSTPIYHLSNPDQVMTLESDLDEISGLSYHGGKLYAVQDEKGAVYTLNPSTGKIIDVKKCWKKGDFEGIEVVDGYVFVLKSNGNLYRSPLGDICEEKTDKIDLGFDKEMNFEGLGYDPFKKTLLIVAKRSEYAKEKEVYCLPIGDLLAIGQPCYVISEEVLKERLMKNKKSWSEKMAHKMSYSFNPSGIAVHPENGDIYILSSPVHQLLLLTKNWKIKKILQLDSGLFKQPEGICFDNDLNLYIGNEARKGKAKILKFNPK
jgi:uncharacterized protein YjiK